MDPCQLRIVLTENDGVFRPGDFIQGHVVVEARERAQCDGLSVSVKWRAAGEDSEEQYTLEKQSLFSGMLTPGERSYPFRLRVPEGPAAHDGALFKVDHVVSARARFSGIKDPRALLPIRLEGARTAHWSSEAGKAATTAQDITKLQSEGPRAAIGCAAVTGLLCVIGLAACVKIENLPFEWTTRGVLGLVLGQPGGWGLLASIALFVFGWVHRATVERLGVPNVEVGPLEVRRGESITVKVSLQPTKATRLAGIRAVLKGTEQVSTGSGDDRKTRTNENPAQDQEIGSGARDLAAGESLVAEGRVKVPANVAPSFKAEDHLVRWVLEVRIDVPGMPDWTATYPLVVLP